MSIQLTSLSLTVAIYISNSQIHESVCKLLAKTQHYQISIHDEAAFAAHQSLDLLIVTSDLIPKAVTGIQYLLIIDLGLNKIIPLEDITYDTINWPFEASVFLRKINGLVSLISRQMYLASQAQVLSHYHEMMIAEQTIARNIFLEFVKTDEIDFPEIKFHLSPMSTYNGDILLASRYVDGQLFIVLGDFTGHGLSAAIGSIPMAEAFYAMTAKNIPPALIVREINKKLNKLLPSQIFCAACFIYFDAQKAELSLWQGGMPTGYLFNGKSLACKELISTQLPLGILSDSDFDPTFSIIPITEPSRLVLFSDGFLEVKSSKQQIIARDEIIDCVITATPSNQIAQLRRLYQRYSSEQASLDDIAILSIELIP
jgi:serine phosphatase RsbU (regulator of sigma subunit)